MSKLDIVRAWKDEEYCESLSDTQRASLPENPAGVIELTDMQLAVAEGGTTITLPICPTLYSCITFCITITFTIAVEEA